MKYKKEEEKELLSMACESNEDVRNILYETYEPTIRFIVKKYSVSANKLGLEAPDLYQEALIGFTDALNSYDETKAASLKTFMTICIERRLQKVLEKANRLKNKINHDILSLDYEYENAGLPLIEIIADETSDPLVKFSEKEQLDLMEAKIKQILSENEYVVYNYMKKGLGYQEIAKKLDKSPKQIDNTMQRLKSKVKLILKGEENEKDN